MAPAITGPPLTRGGILETRILLISGRQGSGKSSLAKEILRLMARNPGVYLNLLNFADPLYEAHNAVLDVFAKYGLPRVPKDGDLLQRLGDWARAKDPDIFVKLCRNRIAALSKGYSSIKTNPEGPIQIDRLIFIVGDTRFKNELMLDPHALRVRLECPREIRKARAESWRENENHKSEIDLDDWLHMFDMVLETDKLSTEDCANLVIAQLMKDNWLDKREE